MIVFATLFLGLVSGSQEVEVIVSSGVASVRLELDHQPVGELHEPPWQTAIDFGERLTIHELAAIGYDSNGVEIARTSQTINTPKQNVDSRLLLDEWQHGIPRSARLIWQSADAVELELVDISLDGTEIDVSDPSHFVLPELSPSEIHFLVANSHFSEGQSSTAEAVFGGKFQDSVPTSLTAIMVTKLPRGKKAKTAASQRISSRNERPIDIVAVDKGSADVVFIRAEGALRALQVLDASLARKSQYGGAHLGKNDHLVVMSAQPRSSGHETKKLALFPLSQRLSADDQPLPSALARLGFRERSNSPEKLTNAVAVAGLQAAATKRRRAVIVLTTDCSNVSGSWSADTVRDYLAEIRVPFEVWLLGGNGLTPKGGFCDDAIHVRDEDVYVRQIRRLVTDLSRQSIVWIEGDVKPGSLMVAERG